MTDQQIDEFLEMLAKSPTSARDMVRGLFAAHEAKASPAVPEIDYPELIRAAYATDKKWAQGTNGCSAFARGAQWFRDQVIAAPSQEPVTLTRDDIIRMAREAGMAPACWEGELSFQLLERFAIIAALREKEGK